MEFLKETMSLWDRLKQTEKPILIYGMGDGCEKIFRVCRERKIPVAGIFASDEYVRGHQFLGFPVMTYRQAKEQFPDPVILLAFAAFQPELICKINSIAAENELYAPDVPLFGEGVFDLSYVMEHEAELSCVYQMLADEQSRKVFSSILNFKVSGNIGYLKDCETPKQEVFDSFLFLSKEESYVDLGAYDGDTVKEFLSQSGGKYHAVYAFEPNPKNFRKLKRNVGETGHIHLIPKGAWENTGELCFRGKAGRSSSIAEDGTLMVEVVPVDDVVEHATLIKFDVEGAEAPALRGCSRLMKEDRPKLCLSAYHRNEDLFALPLLVQSIRNDYRVYLRHHPYIPAWETIYYFV